MTNDGLLLDRISNSRKEERKIGDQRMMGRAKYTLRFPVLKANGVFFPILRIWETVLNWELTRLMDVKPSGSIQNYYCIA